jgi:PAS domain S-box-containing protein
MESDVTSLPHRESTGEQPVRSEDVAADLLLEAGVALAESLDMGETLGGVARLTVPRLADLCVIDLLEEDGSIRQMAVACVDERIATELHSLRERQQLDPTGEHPVARVIARGEPELLAHMTSGHLRGFASGSAHARFMITKGYHSAVVAPLVARRRTLGALSVLRLGDGRPYSQEDLELVSELARRSALAIDNARLFSEARRVEQRLEAILVNLAEAITLTDSEQQIVFANQAAAELLGAQTPADLLGVDTDTLRSRFFLLDEQGRELPSEQLPRKLVFVDGRSEPLLVRNIERESGRERWLMARSSPLSDPETGQMLYSVNVYEDITEVKRVQVAESFMAEASRVLASALEYPDALQRIARLAVPQIADWCAIDVLDENGLIRRVAVHHGDPRKLALAEELERDNRPTIDDPGGIAAVIRSGKPRLYTDITPEALAADGSERPHREVLQTIGAKAVIIVPLAAPTRTVGAITLVSSESLRRLSEADLSLAVRLGRRAGTTVESARLNTERKRIADTLQAALLPESLPEIPGVATRALYHAAGELNDVGGDFYDVCAYGPGRWLLTIGDVLGKGPRAAGVTALARHTLRAAAMLGQTPTGILQTLHGALRLQPAGADMCTACLVTIEPRQDFARLTVTLGGHPPPVLIGADGEAAQIGQPGTLLGVLDEIKVSEVDAELHPGQTLLLYTDGVVEAGPSGDQLGEQGLLELCAEAPTLSIEGLLARIEERALQRAGGQLRDDIAMLALRSTDVPAESA